MMQHIIALNVSLFAELNALLLFLDDSS